MSSTAVFNIQCQFNKNKNKILLNLCGQCNEIEENTRSSSNFWSQNTHFVQNMLVINSIRENQMSMRLKTSFFLDFKIIYINIFKSILFY